MFTRLNGVHLGLIPLLVVIFIIFSPLLAEGKWSLTPRIYVGGEYNDNIFLTERNEQTDFITVVSPGINLQYVDPTAEVNVDYEYQRFWYDDFPEFDYSGHRGRALARKDFPPWFEVGIRETFIRSEDPIELTGLEEFERPSIRTGRNRYTRNIVEPWASFRFGENRSIRLGYRNNILRNDREDIADLDENAANALLTFRLNIRNGIEVFYEHINREYHTTVPPEPDRDHSGDEIGGRYTYYFNPTTSVFAEYRYYHRDFERESRVFGSPDYKVHDSRGGFSYELYENVSLSASAGYAIVDAEDRKSEESFSGRGDLSAAYKRLTMSLYGEAGFDEDFTSAENLGLNEFWRAGVNAGYQVLERLSVAGFFYIEGNRFPRQFPNVDRRDTLWSARASLSYQLLRWLFFSLDYVHNERDSNIPFESYRENRYLGRLTFQYDIAERFQ